MTVLAHDLSNYITPLQSRLDLMLQRARRLADDRLTQDAEYASRALKRLHAIIADLLDVGRLEQGIFSISRQPIDLASLVHDIAGVMHTQKLKIVVRAPDEMRLEADPARLRQAVENLIANALKHSPDGLPVDVGLESEKRDDGEWAIVTVRDEGPGIAPDLMPRLFTRFSAGPSSNGLGLGLYLARSIAEAHGGTLTVSSTPGQGASFRLSVPCF